MAIDAVGVIVFKSLRFRVSTLIRYVCVFICIHFQHRVQIDAFSVNTLERISVGRRPKRNEMYALSEHGLGGWEPSQTSKKNASGLWLTLKCTNWFFFLTMNVSSRIYTALGFSRGLYFALSLLKFAHLHRSRILLLREFWYEYSMLFVAFEVHIEPTFHQYFPFVSQ